MNLLCDHGQDTGIGMAGIGAADTATQTAVEAFETIDVWLVETLVPLATHFQDYCRIEPHCAVLDLDADSPAYAADFQGMSG